MASTWFETLDRPTVLVDEARARRNIERMAARAAQRGLAFRPHFKTHQSAVIGNWFRDYGVRAITVSSLEMAAYFAAHGWDDITIAFPVNVRQLDGFAELAQRVRLQVLVTSPAVVEALERRLPAPVGAWLSIDAGQHREGLAAAAVDQVAALIQRVQAARRLRHLGFLAHFGDTYAARGAAAVTRVFQAGRDTLLNLKAALAGQGVDAGRLSLGDTPSCTLVDDLSGVAEIRPGNFVFYDLMQQQNDVCAEADIAAVLACPVVDVYPERSVILLYGGAVHLSKDYVMNPDGSRAYGRVAGLTPAGWGPSWDAAGVASLSQEHGVIAATAEQCRETAIGDILAILPAHICLTVSATPHYQTLTGQRFAAWGA